MKDVKVIFYKIQSWEGQNDILKNKVVKKWHFINFSKYNDKSENFKKIKVENIIN